MLLDHLVTDRIFKMGMIMCLEYKHDILIVYLEEGVVGILPICVKGIVPHAKQKNVDLILLSSEKHERCKM